MDYELYGMQQAHKVKINNIHANARSLSRYSRSRQVEIMKFIKRSIDETIALSGMIDEKERKKGRRN